MASSRITAAFARCNIHYGWVVVAVTFLTLLVTAAAMGTPGVMIVPLEREFGWSHAQISSALALRILLFGLFGPFAAAFMNRFGVRRVIVCALMLIAAGLVVLLLIGRGLRAVRLCGIGVRRWHGVDRDGTRRDGGDTLVQSSAWTGHGHSRS